jgi:methyl-accepting chemotaxis protein
VGWGLAAAGRYRRCSVAASRKLVGRLKRLRRVIATMYGDGDLTGAQPSKGGTKSLRWPSDFNRLIGELRDHRRQGALQLGRSRQCFRQLIGDAKRVASGSKQQRDAALATAGAWPN